MLVDQKYVNWISAKGKALGFFQTSKYEPIGYIFIIHWFVTELFLFQNFLALCASDFYNGCFFLRNIKGFIVQTGDPTNTGKGGTSIWNRKFEDEFKENLKVFANRNPPLTYI